MSEAVWSQRAETIPTGGSATFRLCCGGRILDGFVVNFEGALFAYVNRCAHVGTPLDLWPNDFFTGDGRFLIGATHGAIYRPETGECVAGPCVGRSLTPFPVTYIEGRIQVRCTEP
jgi:nitrite reductase/ring-hydroxylating ferredoxin subunit